MFLSFLTAMALSNPDALREIVSKMPWPSWLALTLMVVALAGSIICALVCLWSRTYVRRGAANAEVSRLSPDDFAPAPSVMYFFQQQVRTLRCSGDHQAAEELRREGARSSISAL